MISRLSVANFKPFGKTAEFPLKPITLVFGPNSSGKSSALHALLLLHHLTFVGEKDTRFTKLGGTTVDLGGWKQFLHQGRGDLPLSLSFSSQGIWGYKLGSMEDQEIRVNWTIERSEKWFQTSCEISTGAPESIFLLRLTQYDNSVFRLERINGRHAAFRELASKMRDFYSSYGASNSISVDRLLEVLAYVGVFSAPLGQPARTETVAMRLSNLDADREALQLLVVPLVEPRCSQVIDALWDISRSVEQYAADSFFITDIPENERESFGDWSELERRWSESGFASELGDLESLKGELEEANYRTDDVEPLLEMAREHVLHLLSTVFQDLDRLTYLGPLRSYPSRQNTPGVQESLDWWATGDFAWAAMRTDEELRERVSHWLSAKKLDTGLRIAKKNLFTQGDVEALVSEAREKPEMDVRDALSALLPAQQDLVLVDERTGTLVSIRDVGLGIAQVLPVLVQALGSRSKTHIVEQPEIHLHPALQAQLADVFIEGVARGNSFILETHSEHLILRMLRRIRETTNGEQLGELALTPDKLSVIYVGSDEHGTAIYEIPVTEEGAFARPWPKGFFMERLEELE